MFENGQENNLGETVKKIVFGGFGPILAIWGYFGYFVLNSGGPGLPGMMVEIDFRLIFEKNEKYITKYSIVDIFQLFSIVFVIKIEFFIPQT